MLENESYYRNELGLWKKTVQSEDMSGAVKRRIQYAKEHGARIANKGKNDTVIARPIVIQMDAELVESHKDYWHWDVIEILEEMFGEDNIVGFSIHRDETNVHVHVIFVPCVEKKQDNGKVKCAISQTKFFRNPRELAGMHRKMRKALNEKGYDIQQENKPIEQQLAGYYDKNGEWHQQGLTPDQLKELTGRKEQLDEKEREIMLTKQELDILLKAMEDVQEKANLQTQMKSLIEEKNTIKKMKAEADGMLEKAYSVSDVCQKVLAKEHTLNKDFLDFLDRVGHKYNRQYRTTVEKLYKMFNDERRTVTSPWEEELDEIRRERNRKRTVDDIAIRFNSSTEKEVSGYDFF